MNLLFIVALVLFIVDTFVPVKQVKLSSAGLAFLTAGFLWEI